MFRGIHLPVMNLIRFVLYNKWNGHELTKEEENGHELLNTGMKRHQHIRVHRSTVYCT